MTIPTEAAEKTNGEQARRPLYEMTRLVLLAGIGAVSLAQDEINHFLDKLVERGEMAEGDARKLVREMVDRREKLEQEHKLHRKERSAATQAEVEALKARVADLTRQIEELRDAAEGKSRDYGAD